MNEKIELVSGDTLRVFRKGDLIVDMKCVAPKMERVEMTFQNVTSVSSNVDESFNSHYIVRLGQETRSL